MRMTMKKLTQGATRLLVLALGLGLVSTGWAAAPVAVWDGAADSVYDFSNLTHNGYVLGNLGSGYYNSVAADYSYLQIGNENQKAAITLKKSSGNMGASTVIIKCENLMDHENCNRAVLSFLNSNNPYIGVGQYNSGSHMSSFIWSNAMWGDSANVKKDGAFSGSPITIALAYSYDEGTAYYVDGVKICSAGGLRASGYGPQGVCIGGVGADGSGAFYAMKGMKVTAIAFFDSKISDADIAAYRFPSEYIKYTKISADTSVSGINAQLATSTFESNKVSVANGVRITVDEAFETTIPLWIKSDGSINLYADTQPATSYFTGVDFSGVKGGVLRSWLTPGVVGYNFRSNSGSDTSLALVSGGTWLPASAANEESGSTTEMFADGLSTFEWSSKNTWAWSSGTLLNGYLDDGGSQANITLSNVPYERYDVVVYAATDTEDASFNAVTVNGTQYTWDENSGEAVAGSATWGISHQPLAAYGKNALRIKNLSGPLKIKGGSNSNGARGCIAAVQIMPTTAADVEVKDYTLTLDGTAKNWSTGTWTSGGIEVSAPTLARNVEIVATASTALTIDSAVKVSQLTISGTGASVVTISNGSGGSLSVGEVVVASGILKPNGTPSTSMKLRVQDGGAIDLASAAASGYYVKIAGQGVLKDGVYTGALFSSANISGGAAQLRGITLSANATIRCDYNWGIIRSSYDSGTLSLGGYTLTKVGSANFWICNVTDSASGNIVVSEGNFATIKTKSTFSNATLTIGDGATLRMDTPDGGGATDLEVKNLVCDAGSTVNIAAARTLKVTTALTANGTMKPLGTVTCNGNMTIGGDVVVPSDKTWTVAGTLTVANGGKLEIKNNSLVPGALALADGGTLKIANVSDAAHKVTTGTVTFPASGAAIIDVSDIPDLDENDEVDVLTGNTSLPSDVSTLKIVGKQYSLESESNTLKVVNDGGLVWNDGWTTGKDPTKYGDAIIASSGTVALGGTSLSFNSVTLSGSGTVSFSATGSETVSIKNLEIGAGVTITANAALDLTGCTITGDGTLDIPVGTTYAMDGVTSSAKVTVEGTLETSGTTTLSGANTSAAGSLVRVIGGVSYIAFNQGQISGNITIDADAELSLGGVTYAPHCWDPLNPNGTVCFDISGTLNLGDGILFLYNGTTLELRANSSIVGGNGWYVSSYGSIVWSYNASLHAYGNAEINAMISTKTDTNPTFTVDENATLTISKAFMSQSGGNTGSITKTGAGTLKFTQETLTKPITINEGKVQLRRAFTSGLAISIASGAELELGVGHGNSDINATDISFAGVTGTGTIRFSSSHTGYYTLPISAANMFATTLHVANDNAGKGVVIPWSGGVTTNRTISGSGKYRTDWSGSSGVADRYFLALQDANSEWSGIFHENDRMHGMKVAGAEGAANKTLTLSGTQIQTNTLEVEPTGSVNLTGAWLGDTTIDGEFGGTGRITGALTFNAGSTFKVWATGGLSVTGSVTFPEDGISVDVSNLTIGREDSTVLLTATSGSNFPVVGNFTLTGSSTHVLSKTGQKELSLLPIIATYSRNDGSGIVTPYADSVDVAINALISQKATYPNAYVTVFIGAPSYYTAELLASNGIAVDAETGNYVVAEAKIDDTLYPTIEAAIADAGENDTVVLARNISKTEIAVNKEVEFSEGDYTFTGSFTGSGTLVLPALWKSGAATRIASGWTGTVVLPNVNGTVDGFRFDYYGKVGSTIKIENGFSGWLNTAQDARQVKANLIVNSAFTISGTNSGTWYNLAKMSGTGNSSLIQSNAPSGFHILVMEDYSGTLSNTIGSGTPTALTVSRLNLAAAPVAGQKLINTTTPNAVNLETVYVGDVQQSVTLAKGSDGIYAALVSVTKGSNPTTYYATVSDAMTAAGSDAATITLLGNTDSNISLVVGQSLVTGGFDVGTVSTGATYYHVVNNAGVYTVVLDTHTITIPSVANTTVSVSYTSGGEAQEATAAGDITVDAGTSLTATWTAASGYKITAGASQTINPVVAAQTLASPTVEAKGATVSGVTFNYGDDFATATVRATVSGDATTYTLTVDGTDYEGEVSGSTVTFSDVATGHASAYDNVSYTITATDAGSSTIDVSGGSGSTTVADVINANWINENATTHGLAAAGGSWTNSAAVSYVDGAATITDNRFEATEKSTTSRVVMEFNVCFTATSDGDVSGEAQGALKLGEVNDEATFMVLAPGGSWTAVSNVGLTPNPTATNKVVMTFDYALNKYGVSIDGNVLTNSLGEAFFPLAKNNATGVQDIDFAGTGTLVSMKGDQLEGYMVKDNAGGWYATIEAATQSYDSANGPYTVLHDGTPPSGWKIDGSTLIKVATGLFFMAY